MFDVMVPSFDPSGGIYNPGTFAAEQGGNPQQYDLDYSQAFSGLGKIQTAKLLSGDPQYPQYPAGGNVYQIIRTRDGASDPKDGELGLVSVGQDGAVKEMGWAPYAPDSDAKFIGQMLAAGGIALGGMGAMGFLGGAGGAAAGGAGTISGGSGLTGGGVASGAGLTATPGAGLTLAGTTGTGAGLSTAGLGSWGPAGLSAAGAGAGAALSGGLGGAPGAGTITGGSGLTGGTGLGGTGAGLSASPGAGLSLAAPTGTGAGLSVPGFATTGGVAGAGGLTNALSSLGGNGGGLFGTGISPGQALQWGGNLLGGYMNDRAAGKAQDAQLRAIAESNALLDKWNTQARADSMPALEARNAGLSGYRNLLADPSGVVNDPSYAFGRDQSMQALERSAAARGGLYSGRAGKEAMRFGNDYATTKFDNALNRHGNLAGLGQVGANTLAQTGQTYANNVSNNALSSGNVNASAYVNKANNWGDTISSIMNNYQTNELLKRYLPGFNGIGGN